jgi:hypothetical protein
MSEDVHLISRLARSLMLQFSRILDQRSEIRDSKQESGGDKRGKKRAAYEGEEVFNTASSVIFKTSDESQNILLVCDSMLNCREMMYCLLIAIHRHCAIAQEPFTAQRNSRFSRKIDRLNCTPTTNDRPCIVISRRIVARITRASCLCRNSRDRGRPRNDVAKCWSCGSMFYEFIDAQAS